MGEAMATRLISKGWDLIVFDNLPTQVAKVASRGAEGAFSAKDAVKKLSGQKLVWIMAPHAAVDSIIEQILPALKKGDVVIDGGNSFYKDSVRRAEMLAKKAGATLPEFLEPFYFRVSACVLCSPTKGGTVELAEKPPQQKA